MAVAHQLFRPMLIILRVVKVRWSNRLTREDVHLTCTNISCDNLSTPGRCKDFLLFTTASRPVLGPTQPPIEWIPGCLSLGVKRPGHEADYTPPSSAKVKSVWHCSSTLPFIFMVWCLVEHRDNFAFTFPICVPMAPDIQVKYSSHFTKFTCWKSHSVQVRWEAYF